MPARLEPFVTNEIYHVFNKTIDRRSVFESERYCLLFLEILRYYRSQKATISFSRLKDLDHLQLAHIRQQTTFVKYFQVDVLAYCLMPNHFHLLLQQKKEGGIQKYLGDTVNSFTRHINLLAERRGPLFLPRFKAQRIQSDEQLTHVSRYIHLNPYSSGIIKTISALKQYAWSSFRGYFSGKNGLIDTSVILDLFDGNRNRYDAFVQSNAEHQKSLEYIKHIKKW